MIYSRCLTIIVCPTSTSTPESTFHPEIEIDDQPTRVMCEMIGAVDARALGERVGHLTHDEMRAVDDALELILDSRLTLRLKARRLGQRCLRQRLPREDKEHRAGGAFIRRLR